MRTLVTLWLALAVTACVDGLDTGTHDQSIIGGQIASPSEFPAVVALESGPGNWDCTGTLVHAEWVLTAAHCVVGAAAANLQVRFDDADVNDTVGGTVVEVAAIHAHPEFDDNIWDNDIAVLELARAVTDRAPTPIRRTPIDAGTTVTQVGYGDSDDNGGGAGVLRKLITENVSCDDSGDPELSDANLLCFRAGDGTATCYGDSGGPTYVAAGAGLAVVGVNSGGTEDLCDDGYDLQTSVPGELDFVDRFLPAGDDLPGDDDPPSDDPGDDGDGDDEGGAAIGGCAATGDPGGLGMIVLGVVAAARRRRRHVRVVYDPRDERGRARSR